MGPPAPWPRLSLAPVAPLSQRLRGKGVQGSVQGPLPGSPTLLILFCRWQETEFSVDVSEYLGPLLFVKLRKRHLLQDDAWFCNWISVQGPGANGDEFRFPCYRWVEGDRILSLPEGTGERFWV